MTTSYYRKTRQNGNPKGTEMTYPTITKAIAHISAVQKAAQMRANGAYKVSFDIHNGLHTVTNPEGVVYIVTLDADAQTDGLDWSTCTCPQFNRVKVCKHIELCRQMTAQEDLEEARANIQYKNYADCENMQFGCDWPY
jgi:hypothetical protein